MRDTTLDITLRAGSLLGTDTLLFQIGLRNSPAAVGRRVLAFQFRTTQPRAKDTIWTARLLGRMGSALYKRTPRLRFIRVSQWIAYSSACRTARRTNCGQP